MKARALDTKVEVTADGEGLVSHAGVFLLRELADRTGLTEALSEAMAPTRERRSAHDPGVVLRDLAVAIAEGGDCVCDLGVLRGQDALFGAVASESTPHRVLKSIDAKTLAALRAARAKAAALTEQGDRRAEGAAGRAGGGAGRPWPIRGRHGQRSSRVRSASVPARRRQIIENGAEWVLAFRSSSCAGGR